MDQRQTLLFLAVIFFSICITKQGISQTPSRSFNSAFNNYFTKSHTLSLNLSDEVYLDKAVSIFKLGNRIFWGEEQRLSYFDKDGNIVKTKNIRGRGPGKVLDAIDYDYNSKGRISILDLSTQKIKIYDQDLNFIKEFLLDRNRSSKFALDNQNQSFTLNELLFTFDALAISKYDSAGSKIGSWGKIPKAGRLQRANEDGGGITTDDNGNVYYFYQGSHKIWKLDASTNSISIFNNKPSYFKQIEDEKIKNAKRSKKLFYLGYEGTRVMGLYYLQPNIIIQQMETGNPFITPSEELNFYLEVWNTEGKKLASKLQIPFPIAWTNADSIAILKQYTSGLLEESGNTEAFDIFQHNFGN
jgi:hypothetical protein